MFDVTARITYNHVPNWHRDIVRVCTDIPIVLCGNKVDVKERQVKPKNISWHRKKNIQYYEISVKVRKHKTKHNPKKKNQQEKKQKKKKRKQKQTFSRQQDWLNMLQSNYNYEKPFVYLLRRLLGDPTLQLTAEAPLPLPDIKIDMNMAMENEKMVDLVQQAQGMELPDGGEDDWF